MGQCEKAILYYMSYYEDKEIKGLGLAHTIQLSCDKTAIYHYYMFMKSIKEGNYTLAQQIYYETQKQYPEQLDILKEQRHYLNKLLPSYHE